MHPIQKLFGNRLRQLRKEQELRPADVAAHIGCDVSHYYSIERGTHPPSFTLLLAIAKTFKVDETDLFVWPGSGTRHDLREQVRLASPADLASIRAALADAGVAPVGPRASSPGGRTPAAAAQARGRTSPADDEEAAVREEPRRRSRR